MADRGQRLAHLPHGRGVERVLLALHRPAAARVRAIARHALCHEPSHPHRLPGGEQVVRALGPQAVGRRGIAFGVAHATPAEGGQLMDDHVRPRPAHGLRDLIGIERVRDHRHRAQLAEHRLLGLAARHAVNLMTRGNQTRHQLPVRSLPSHLPQTLSSPHSLRTAGTTPTTVSGWNVGRRRHARPRRLPGTPGIRGNPGAGSPHRRRSAASARNVSPSGSRDDA